METKPPICRFCLKTLQIESSFSLNDVSICNLIQECLQVQITMKNNLPQSICRQCYDNMIAFNDFKKESLKNMKWLEDELETRIKVEIKSVEIPVDKLPRPNTPDDNRAFKPKFKPKDHCEYACNICKETFSNRSTLHSHRARHFAPTRCEFTTNGVACPREFYQLGHYSLHARNVHKAGKVFTCTYDCGQAFYVRAQLEFHVRTKHERKDSRVVEVRECEICGARVKRLTSHLNVVHGVFRTSKRQSRGTKVVKHDDKKNPTDKQWQCPQCENTYNDENSFTRHARIHLNDQIICPFPYASGKCSRVFFNETSYCKHVKTLHKLEKSFNCSNSMCSKTFYFRVDAETHEKICTATDGTAASLCSLCGKNYKSLVSHLSRIHGMFQTKTTFNCRRCKCDFKNATEHRKHSLMTHPLTRTCEICGLRVKSRNFLKHVKNHEYNSTSTRVKKMQDKDKPKVDLGLLEEDDEFEEFPVEDWTAKDKSEDDVNVWEDNWEDDNVEDDFNVQLRAQLEKQKQAAVI